MYPAIDEATLWIPKTESDKELVREQMRRLLETSHFRNSRRYPTLFRFIVEEALEGRGEFLKERFLGIQVFDRPVDYDTASDPIVRVTIAEIRKRIAQYYHEQSHDSEMRIELLPGHYVPEFRLRRNFGSFVHVAEEVQPEVAPSRITQKPPETVAEPNTKAKSNSWLIYTAASLALCLCAGFAFWKWDHPAPIDEFWKPVLSSQGIITFCLPNGAGKNPGMASIVPEDNTSNTDDPAASQKSKAATFLDHESLGENVVFSDVLAALRISNLMASKGRDSRFRLNISTTLDDLRQGPSILIGGMDNQWTLRAISSLRFHFGGDDSQETFWIVDSENPQNKDWALALKTHYAKVTHDYAIIARIHDETTGKPEVIVAGIGMSGTAAAGEFLADPEQVAELSRRVGKGFKDRDFEAVLSTVVVDGIAGSPRILKVAVW